MAFQELLNVHGVKHVEQKAFDGGVSHRGIPGCVDCSPGPRVLGCGGAPHVPAVPLHLAGQVPQGGVPEVQRLAPGAAAGLGRRASARPGSGSPRRRAQNFAGVLARSDAYIQLHLLEATHKYSYTC